jgi:hypothetical protein
MYRKLAKKKFLVNEINSKTWIKITSIENKIHRISIKEIIEMVCLSKSSNKNRFKKIMKCK